MGLVQTTALQPREKQKEFINLAVFIKPSTRVEYRFYTLTNTAVTLMLSKNIQITKPQT